MRVRLANAIRFLLLALAIRCSQAALAQPIAESPENSASDSALLGLPPLDGPIVVDASFQLLNISQIEDDAETVAFSGVLTLVWKDARQAFDPATEGVSEKVLSGAFQFNEVSPGWYPQVTLANVSGQYDSQAVVLRVKPDGTSTLVQEIEAVARVYIGMRRFPFDRQHLQLVFRAFGFDTHDVVLHAEPDSASVDGAFTKLPQWTLKGIEASVQTMNEMNANGMGANSVFVVTLDLRRESLFMLRLVVIPLCVIVMLSWVVFWMDRASVGDRMSVSFVGILTAVAYEVTLVGIVPNVSYFTLMNGFLNLSFLIMCASVVVNLYVAALDRRGHERGDRIDRRCRWLFPLAYFGLNAAMVAVVFLFF